MRLLLAALFCALPLLAVPARTRSFAIPTALVPSDQSNFPVLVKLSGGEFKSVANGGLVANASGFDILFWTDAGLSSAAAAWEIDYYDAVNGVGWFWIKIATVSHSSPTTLYISYGDPTISTFQSTASTVWSNGYDGVWHMSADSSTVALTDSTTNANNGTNHSSTAGAGQIAGAGVFVAASNQYASLTDAAALQPATLTVSAWFKASSAATSREIFRKGNNGYFLRLNPSHLAQVQVFDSGGAAITQNTVGVKDDGAWHYLVATFDATSSTTAAEKIYIDNVAAVTQNAGSTGNIKYTANAINIASDVSAPTTTWNGSLDEIHVATGVRSADWITTEYNNQSNPAAFAVVGAQSILHGNMMMTGMGN